MYFVEFFLSILWEKVERFLKCCTYSYPPISCLFLCGEFGNFVQWVVFILSSICSFICWFGVHLIYLTYIFCYFLFLFFCFFCSWIRLYVLFVLEPNYKIQFCKTFRVEYFPFFNTKTFEVYNPTCRYSISWVKNL